MKNRRSWVSALTSSVSPKTRLYATYAAVFIIFIYGVLMALMLNQLENLVGGIAANIQEGHQIVNLLFRMKLLSLVIFAGIGLFMLMGELGRNRQVQSEMVPILAQIKFLREGDYEKKRPMRKNDELTPLMDELHKLSDHLARGS